MEEKNGTFTYLSNYLISFCLQAHLLISIISGEEMDKFPYLFYFFHFLFQGLREEIISNDV